MPRLPGGYQVRFPLVVAGSTLLYLLALIPAYFSLDGLPAAFRVLILIVGSVANVSLLVTQAMIPYFRKREQYTAKVMDVVVDDFERRMADLGHSAQAVPLRINVMKAKRRFPWRSHIGRRVLTTAYTRGDYDDAELQMEYDEGVGCAGTALKLNKPRFYERHPDEEKRGTELDLLNMPAVHRAVTREIQSILSLPIYHPDDHDQTYPIGILNVDSLHGTLEHTHFDEAQVQNAAIKMAALAGILFD